MEKHREVESIKKSFDILTTIKNNHGSTLADLNEELPFSRSMLYEHLVTLHRIGVLTKNGTTYHISLRMLDYGGTARQRYKPYITGRKEMLELARRENVLVQVAFPEENKCTYVFQVGEDADRMDELRIGTSLDYHSSAVGKAILSSYKQTTIEEVIQEIPLTKQTPNTITNKEEFQKEIEIVREEGVAFDFEEQILGVDCVAIPVEFSKDILGAVSASTKAQDASKEYIKNDLADKLHDVGKVIESDRKYEQLLKRE